MRRRRSHSGPISRIPRAPRFAAVVLGLLLSATALTGLWLWRPWPVGSASLRAAGDSVFPLRTEVGFDTGETEPERVTVEGTGTVLFDRFVLTVAHAVTMERLEKTVRTPRGDITLPVEGRRISEKTWLVASDRRIPLVPLAKDAEADLALFLLPRGTDLPAFPYPIGDSEALDLGDPIALLGKDPDAGVLARKGSVAALRGTGLVASVANKKRIFLITLALTSGESGAPVVAGRRREYELVGLAQGTYVGPRQLAWAVRIGPALETLSLRADGVLPQMDAHQPAEEDRQDTPGALKAPSREVLRAELRRFLRLCGQSRMVMKEEPRARESAPGAPQNHPAGSNVAAPSSGSATSGAGG